MESKPLPLKLAAILYADVVEYSRLTGEDEQGTHRRLSEYLDVISKDIGRHNGRVVHYAGDAVLADFGTVADALICAASVQRQLSLRNEDVPEDRKVRFRIGVNLGDVIEDRGDIYGDGVNVAARLESLAEPGGICVSESVHTVVGNKLPFDYEFMGEQKVKNIAKPVKAYRARLQPDSELPTPSKAHKRGKPTPSYIAVTAVVVLVVTASVFGWLRPWEPREEPDSIDRMAFPLPDKPSIAVLLFTNMSDDPEQEYFSDGISEDIITDLSRLSNLIVIARNSSFTYKGSPIKVQQVGQDLGVRYVLEGSVRKAGDRVRITAQLVDTSSGHHLWAERYDRKLTDIFELQDDITRQIVNELAIHLSEDDRRDLARIATNSFEAYDLFLRGQQISAQFTEEGLASAVELYRQAIRLDPGYAHAYGALGVARIRQFLIGYSDSPERTKDRALEMARKAESLDPTSHQIQWSLGYIYMYRKQFDEAEKAAKRAVSLSPNYADGYAMLALIKNNRGQAGETISLLEKAMALNPYYTWDYVFQLSRAYYAKGEYDKAAPYLRDAIERNPAVGYPRLFLAATYVNLGDMEDAEWEITQVQMSHPEYALSHVQKAYPIVVQKLMDRFLIDLRAAGLSE